MSIRHIMGLVNTTMPFAWDDSLSVYEMLGKLISKINEVVDEVNLKLPDDFETTFYERFREYTRDEMQRILDSGEFASILDSMIVEFAPIKQEVIEARDGKVSIGAKIRSVEDQLAETDLKTPWFSVEQFGAVGDWDGTNGTDDTLAILNAIESVQDGGKIIFNHNKKYLVTSTITVPSYVTLEFIGDSELVYDGVRNNKYFVMFQKNSKLVGGVFNRADKTWDINSPMSALVIKDHDQVTLLDFTILNFEVGVHLIGDSRGCCYHHISPTIIWDCRTAIKLENYNDGWVNENSFYGGRLAITTTKRIEENNGIELKQGSANVINSNKFYSSSIEGFGTPLHIEGRDNHFYGTRFEFDVSGKFITFKETEFTKALRNGFYGYYGLIGTNKMRTISKTGVIVDGNTVNYFYGHIQPLTSIGGIRLDTNRDFKIYYSSADNQIIFKRGDIDRELLRVGSSGVDFLNQVTSNFRMEAFATAERPAAHIGKIIFDSDLKIPIFGDGTYWVNANGDQV